MPELPEVETIVRDLRGLLAGARFARVFVLRPDLVVGSTTEFMERVEGASLTNIERRAKNIVAHLGSDRLIVNLGMTGRLLIRHPSDAEPTHMGVRFELADERILIYQDVRRFGRLQILSHPEWEAKEQRLGVEPLSERFTPDWLHRESRDSRVAIKAWLMDQHRVVGVGNIYASEALFRARVNPLRRAGRIRRFEASSIRDAIVEVLREAIDFRGTTLLDYRDAAGRPGEFASRLRVYGRAGLPCRACGTPVRRVVQGGRSTFFCPACQP